MKESERRQRVELDLGCESLPMEGRWRGLEARQFGPTKGARTDFDCGSPISKGGSRRGAETLSRVPNG